MRSIKKDLFAGQRADVHDTAKALISNNEDFMDLAACNQNRGFIISE